MAEDMIRVSVATQPHRVKHFVNVLNSMLSQTVQPDEIQVRLNGFLDPQKIADIFAAIDPRLKFSTGVNIGSKAKFNDIEKWPGYTLTIDDDIHYPLDYIERMVGHHKAVGGIVAVHGAICRTAYMSEDADRFMYWDAHDAYTRCNVLGTGTTIFHADHLGGLTFDSFGKGSTLDDPRLAFHAHQQGIPLHVCPRPKGWLTEQEGSQKSGKELWRSIGKFSMALQYKVGWPEINKKAGIE